MPWSGPAVHDDLLAVVDGKGVVRHEFTAAAPNEVWLTDITEHPTAWIPAVVATVGIKRRPVKQPVARLGCPSRVPFGGGR